MNKFEQSKKLEERLIELSVDTIKALRSDSSFPRSVQSQLIRSITSIGANYAEANNASSKADFRNKLYIAKKEAAESLYWIKIIRGLKDEDSAFSKLYDETDEMMRILQSAITTMSHSSK